MLLNTCGITPKRITSGGAHLRDLTPGELRRNVATVGDTMSDLTGPGNEPQTTAPIAMHLTTKLYSRSVKVLIKA